MYGGRRLYYLRERIGKAARIKPGSRARFEALTALPPAAYEEAEALVEETLAEEAEELQGGIEEVVEGEAEVVEAEAVTEEAVEAEAEAEVMVAERGSG